MLPEEVRYVIRIDVAKASHVVCALEVPSGSVARKSTPIAATAEGYAQLCEGLHEWDEPQTLLIGLGSTGSLWEPLYDWVTQAGYTVLLLNPHQTASWAASLRLRAKTDGIGAQTLARGLLADGREPVRCPMELCRRCGR
jgi:transposase